MKLMTKKFVLDRERFFEGVAEINLLGNEIERKNDDVLEKCGWDFRWREYLSDTLLSFTVCEKSVRMEFKSGKRLEFINYKIIEMENFENGSELYFVELYALRKGVEIHFLFRNGGFRCFALFAEKIKECAK